MRQAVMELANKNLNTNWQYVPAILRQTLCQKPKSNTIASIEKLQNYNYLYIVVIFLISNF